MMLEADVQGFHRDHSHVATLEGLIAPRQSLGKKSQSEIPFDEAGSSAESAASHGQHDEVRMSARLLVDDRVDLCIARDEGRFLRERYGWISHHDHAPEY